MNSQFLQRPVPRTALLPMASGWKQHTHSSLRRAGCHTLCPAGLDDMVGEGGAGGPPGGEWDTAFGTHRLLNQGMWNINQHSRGCDGKQNRTAMGTIKN